MSTQRVALSLRGRLDELQVETLKGRLIAELSDTSELRFPAIVDLSRAGGDEWKVTLEVCSNGDMDGLRIVQEICSSFGLAIAGDEPALFHDLSIGANMTEFGDRGPEDILSDAESVSVSPSESATRSIYDVRKGEELKLSYLTASERKYDMRAGELVDDLHAREAASAGVETQFELSDRQDRVHRIIRSEPPIRKEFLEADEVVELAKQLSGIVWSWRLDDFLGLGEVADFWTMESLDPDTVAFDLASVTGRGYISGSHPWAEFIDIPVATLAGDLHDSGTLVRIFEGMSAAISEVFGSAVEVGDEPGQWLEWGDLENYLYLVYQPPSVRLIIRRGGEV